MELDTQQAIEQTQPDDEPRSLDEPSVALRPDPIAKIILFTFVLTSGAAVMMYEFLAVRFLARSFGGTLQVWSFEIAVCLAALALGYSLGGRLADRYQSQRVMALGLMAAGITGLAVEKLAAWAGELFRNAESAMYWHTLFAAAVSTFVPLFALGTILPQAIRLQTAQLDRVGRSSGSMITYSTIGSIAGVLAIVPLMLRWDLRIVLFAVSGTLIAVAILGALPRSRRIVAVGLLVFAVWNTPARGQEVIFEQYSAYHHVLVVDSSRTGMRTLMFDDTQQTIMSLRDPQGRGFEYKDFFHVPAVFNPTIKRALFIGLGGGTGPKTFLKTYPKMQIDVVEIDPVVIRVAKEYFALPEDRRLRVTEMDGRVYLQRSRARYDVIVVDAYGTGPYGSYLPYHMATTEFFAIARQKMNNGGCLVFNAVGTFGGLNDNVVRSLLATLRSSFEAVYVFKAKSSLNTVYVAMKYEAEKARNLKPWPDGPWIEHYQSAKQLQDLVLKMDPSFVKALPVLSQRITQLSRGHSLQLKGPILTDNYAPVDIGPGR